MQTEPLRGTSEETPPPLLTKPIEPDDRTLRAEVWRIAWPSVLTFLLMTTNSILDRAFVGQLKSTEALAAVGFGGQVMFLLVSLSMAISVGTTALVARFTGADEPENAVTATGQSVVLSLVMGLVCTLAVWLSLNPLLHVLGLTPAAQAQCQAFLHMAFIGMIPMFLANVLGAGFRGIGDTRTPLKVMFCANLVHIFGDYALMLGHFGAPKLGLAGGGLAMSAANVVSLLVYLYLIRHSPLAQALKARCLHLTEEWARRILRIGIPAAVTSLLRVLSMMGFTGILARTAEGTSALAALPIGMTAESIAFMPGFGFSIAASTLVGQALGARNPGRAERYAWAACLQGVVVMSVMGIVFFLTADLFAWRFTSDPTVVPIAVSYLKIMALSEPMLAFGLILTGALQGAGDTVRPTILVIVSFWLVRLPMAWLLALVLHLNATGAWIAMAVSTGLNGLLTIFAFKAGAWKRVRV